MACRMITLILTPREEAALATLVSWACNNVDVAGAEYEHLRVVMRAAGINEIGQVNGALNAQR